MSRKKAKKSNMPQIGIFIDKKSANYNLSILETLLSRGATAWQIAEILHKKNNLSNNKELKEVKRYRTQLIYSVIQRKQGRLNDLKNKGYLREENGAWNLTKKGFIALSIEKPELINREMQTNKSLLLEDFKKKINAIPDKPIKEPLGIIQIDLSQIKTPLAKIDPLPFFMMFIEEAKALLSEGIELDRVNEDTLVHLVLSRRSFLNTVRARIGLNGE